MDKQMIIVAFVNLYITIYVRLKLNLIMIEIIYIEKYTFLQVKLVVRVLCGSTELNVSNLHFRNLAHASIQFH